MRKTESPTAFIFVFVPFATHLSAQTKRLGKKPGDEISSVSNRKQSLGGSHVRNNTEYTNTVYHQFKHFVYASLVP